MKFGSLGANSSSFVTVDMLPHLPCYCVVHVVKSLKKVVGTFFPFYEIKHAFLMWINRCNIGVRRMLRLKKVLFPSPLLPSSSFNVTTLWRQVEHICISQHCMGEWGTNFSLMTCVLFQDFLRIVVCTPTPTVTRLLELSLGNLSKFGLTKNSEEGFHVMSYQTNFASHHTLDRHVGFLFAQHGIGKQRKVLFLFEFILQYQITTE